MARPGFQRHPKFRRLVALLGIPEPQVRGLCEMLWEVAYEAGEERIGDSLDVELAAGWWGEPGALTKALVGCGGGSRAGLIEEVPGSGGVYQIHDLFDHAPDYVQKRRKRELQRQSKGNDLRSLSGQCPPDGGQCPPNVRTPAPAPSPKEEPPSGAPRKRSHPAPNPPHPAVEAYREATHRYPAKPLHAGIAQAVGDDPARVRLWGSIVLDWVAHGFKPTNVAGMLEAFAHGGISQPVPRSGAPPGAGLFRGAGGDDSRREAIASKGLVFKVG